MKDYCVESIQELIGLIKKYNINGEYWFRGQPDSSYFLIPGSYRNLYVVADQFDRPVEPRKMMPNDKHGDHVLLLDKIYVRAFFEELDKNNIPYDDGLNQIDKYCLAQHYGVWTPLLDWTTDFIVGLFFACDGRKECNDCAIFLLNPVKLNDATYAVSRVVSSEEACKYVGYAPMAFKGKRFDKRMCRQSGNFTVHGYNVQALESYTLDEDILIKITIPAKLADVISSYLKVFGVTKDSIYVEQDDKDDISKQLASFNENKLNELLEEYRNKWLKTPEEERGVPFHVF